MLFLGVVARALVDEVNLSDFFASAFVMNFEYIVVFADGIATCTSGLRLSYPVGFSFAVHALSVNQPANA